MQPRICFGNWKQRADDADLRTCKLDDTCGGGLLVIEPSVW